jgi:hypothetical protein
MRFPCRKRGEVEIRAQREFRVRLTAGRFNLWLGREEKAEPLIRRSSGRGGIVKARALFGARLPALLDELTDTLVAWYLSKVSIKI